MYKLPADVVTSIEKKYPGINVNEFIHNIVETIIEKTLNDGNCTIRELGKFTAFVADSGRVGREIVRFKFKVSQAFTNKIRYDDFLLNHLSKEMSAKFTEVHENNCKGKKEQREINIKAQSDAVQHSKKKTEENLCRDEVLKIIHE